MIRSNPFKVINTPILRCFTAVKSGHIPQCLMCVHSRNKKFPIFIILLLASHIRAATSPSTSTNVKLSPPQLAWAAGMDFTALTDDLLYVIGGNITGIKHDPTYCIYVSE